MVAVTVTSKLCFLYKIYRHTKVMNLAFEMVKLKRVYKESYKIIVTEFGSTTARNMLPIYVQSMGNKAFIAKGYVYHCLKNETYILIKTLKL